jgi:hypothetical protein
VRTERRFDFTESRTVKTERRFPFTELHSVRAECRFVYNECRTVKAEFKDFSTGQSDRAARRTNVEPSCCREATGRARSDRALLLATGNSNGNLIWPFFADPFSYEQERDL